MALKLRTAVAAIALLIAISAGGAALAQKPGGILKMYSPDSPASMSVLEEVTVYSRRPMMGVQQPRHVRPACEAEQPGVDRARSGNRLVMERRRDRVDLSTATRRQMA
jgi:hypothetical protein